MMKIFKGAWCLLTVFSYFSAFAFTRGVTRREAVAIHIDAVDDVWFNAKYYVRNFTITNYPKS